MLSLKLKIFKKWLCVYYCRYCDGSGASLLGALKQNLYELPGPLKWDCLRSHILHSEGTLKRQGPAPICNDEVSFAFWPKNVPRLRYNLIINGKLFLVPPPFQILSQTKFAPHIWLQTHWIILFHLAGRCNAALWSAKSTKFSKMQLVTQQNQNCNKEVLQPRLSGYLSRRSPPCGNQTNLSPVTGTKTFSAMHLGRHVGSTIWMSLNIMEKDIKKNSCSNNMFKF